MCSVADSVVMVCVCILTAGPLAPCGPGGPRGPTSPYWTDYMTSHDQHIKEASNTTQDHE